MRIEGLTYSASPKNHFASDNNSPVHASVIKAIVAANRGHTLAYGDDYYTERAVDRIKQTFGAACEPFFVFTGTSANVLSLAALTRSYHSVICAESAHLNGAECGAPEKFAGVKLVVAYEGKSDPWPESIRGACAEIRDTLERVRTGG